MHYRREQPRDQFKGKHHKTIYYQGRYHVLFRGKTFRSMRVYQWAETTVPVRIEYPRWDF